MSAFLLWFKIKQWDTIYIKHFYFTLPTTLFWCCHLSCYFPTLLLFIITFILSSSTMPKASKQKLHWPGGHCPNPKCPSTKRFTTMKQLQHHFGAKPDCAQFLASWRKQIITNSNYPVELISQLPITILPSTSSDLPSTNSAILFPTNNQFLSAVNNNITNISDTVDNNSFTFPSLPCRAIFRYRMPSEELKKS